MKNIRLSRMETHPSVALAGKLEGLFYQRDLLLSAAPAAGKGEQPLKT